MSPIEAVVFDLDGVFLWIQSPSRTPSASVVVDVASSFVVSVGVRPADSRGSDALLLSANPYGCWPTAFRQSFLVDEARPNHGEYLRGAAAEPEPGSAGLPAGTRALVTGASGLIGRQVVSVLERAGVDVYAVSRRPMSSEGHVHWITQDLTLTGAARDIVERVEPDVVFHLAGAVTGDRSLDAVHPTMTANLVATVELLEAATRAAVSRIIVSGSLLEEPVDGGAAPVPPSPYGASRFASTAYARMFHAVFETPVTILRPSYAYGPGQDATKLIPYVITTALRGERMELASGERAVDFVYAADIARAYVAAATSVCVEGATIDIGSGEVTRVRDVVELLIDILGPNVACPVFGAIPVRAREQEIRVDTEPAARLLGWTATTSLNEGLEETVAWYVRRTERARTRDR